MTDGEILGFGGFIVTNLVGISWFSRGLQKDVQELKDDLKETREMLKEHQKHGSDLSKDLKYRVQNLEEWKISTNSIIEKLKARTHDLLNMVIVICNNLGIPFTRRENW